jgi:hypothetical protein
MTNSLDRRLARLEGPPAGGPRPIILAPEVCKTTKEWLEQMKVESEGRGHYALGPMPNWPNSVRRKIWVPDD